MKQFPGLSLSNAGSSIGYNGTQNVNYWLKNFSAGLSKAAGKHTLQAGFDFRTIDNGGLAYGTPAGSYSFNGVFSQQYPTKTNGTGADWADLLMGYPSSGTLQTTTPLYFGVHYYAGFVQDDIRVSNRLTVNLGVRYEYETGIGERDNHVLVGFIKRRSIRSRRACRPVLPYAPGRDAVRRRRREWHTRRKPPARQVRAAHRTGLSVEFKDDRTRRMGILHAPTFFGVDATTAPGYVQTNTYVASNNGNQTPANSLSNPFPTGIVQPAGNSAGPLTAIGSTFTFVDQNRTWGS